MKRRTFVKSALAATSLAGLNQLLPSAARAGDDISSDKSQYYELRLYRIKSPQQQKLVDDFWRDAAIPAYNRAGIKPVGAFVELDKPEVKTIYILIPYNSLEAFAALPARLAADAGYQSAGAPYLNAPKSEPAYDRMESSLTIAFEGMRKLQVPPSVEGNKPWIFEMRTYESHSEPKGVNKVEMFNAGEVELMKEVGLSPVFFSQTLIGNRLPNLVYMTSGENPEEHAKHWKAFGEAPLWKKLLADPKYKDNVSNATKVFLKRTPYSQI